MGNLLAKPARDILFELIKKRNLNGVKEFLSSQQASKLDGAEYGLAIRNAATCKTNDFWKIYYSDQIMVKCLLRAVKKLKVQIKDYNWGIYHYNVTVSNVVVAGDEELAKYLLEQQKELKIPIDLIKYKSFIRSSARMRSFAFFMYLVEYYKENSQEMKSPDEYYSKMYFNNVEVSELDNNKFLELSTERTLLYITYCAFINKSLSIETLMKMDTKYVMKILQENCNIKSEKEKAKGNTLGKVEYSAIDQKTLIIKKGIYEIIDCINYKIGKHNYRIISQEEIINKITEKVKKSNPSIMSVALSKFNKIKANLKESKEHLDKCNKIIQDKDFSIAELEILFTTVTKLLYNYYSPTMPNVYSDFKSIREDKKLLNKKDTSIHINDDSMRGKEMTQKEKDKLKEFLDCEDVTNHISSFLNGEGPTYNSFEKLTKDISSDFEKVKRVLKEINSLLFQSRDKVVPNIEKYFHKNDAPDLNLT